MRSLLLKDKYKDSDNTNYDPNIPTFKLPSTYTPSLLKASENCKKTINNIKKITSRLLAQPKRDKERKFLYLPDKHNLTKAQRQAWANISKRKDVLVKPVDKGASLCLMEPGLYHEEIMRQINDRTFYEPINGPLLKDNVTNINDLVESLLAYGDINEDQCKYLQASKNDSARTFYILPKVHKDRGEWPHPDMPPGRPIMADVNTESSRISEYIDFFLQPLACQHEAYLKDTYHFISIVRNVQINPNAFFVTGDVTSLYTRMFTDTAIKKLSNLFHIFPNRHRPDGIILDLLTTICNNNDFKYNGRYYRQHRGFAMGKRFSPSMANIYLLEFDDLVRRYSRLISWYKRFLDDTFFIWDGEEMELERLQEYLCTVEPGIEVKLKWSRNEIDFLDLTLFKFTTPEGNTIIHTRPFFKPTDGHQLVHTKSYHPKHTCRGVLKSQIIRFKRLSSDRDHFNKACNTLFKSLRERGYSRRLLETTKHLIWHKWEDTPQANKTIKPLLPIVMEYNSFNVRLANAWRKEIQKNEDLQEFRVILAYKNSKNLYQHLLKQKRKGVDPLVQFREEPK